MITLKLKAESKAQELILAYLQENASQTLADKINNGVKIVKDGKTLINKKDLKSFMNYATGEAKKAAAKGENSACIEDNIVYSWAIHYFEEDSIEGTLYNEDGTEYKTATKAKSVATPNKVEPKSHQPTQANLFDMLNTTSENVESDENDEDDGEELNNDYTPEELEELTYEAEESEVAEQPKNPEPTEKPQKQPSAFYQTYLKLIEKYNGSLILLRLGDFYEAFNDHATTLASELNLTLTGRDCGLTERVPMVGIPFHAVYDYINKIIERGYKVILAEKLEEVLEFKDIDEYEEPEELSEEEMRAFDSYVDEDSDELPTVSKIVGQTNDEDDSYTEILNAESAKAFEQNALCILYNLFENEITLA